MNGSLDFGGNKSWIRNRNITEFLFLVEICNNFSERIRGKSDVFHVQRFEKCKTGGKYVGGRGGKEVSCSTERLCGALVCVSVNTLSRVACFSSRSDGLGFRLVHSLSQAGCTERVLRESIVGAFSVVWREDFQLPSLLMYFSSVGLLRIGSVDAMTVKCFLLQYFLKHFIYFFYHKCFFRRIVFCICVFLFLFSSITVFVASLKMFFVVLTAFLFVTTQ